MEGFANEKHSIYTRGFDGRGPPTANSMGIDGVTSASTDADLERMIEAHFFASVAGMNSSNGPIPLASMVEAAPMNDNELDDLLTSLQTRDEALRSDSQNLNDSVLDDLLNNLDARDDALRNSVVTAEEVDPEEQLFTRRPPPSQSFQTDQSYYDDRPALPGDRCSTVFIDLRPSAVLPATANVQTGPAVVRTPPMMTPAPVTSSVLTPSEPTYSHAATTTAGVVFSYQSIFSSRGMNQIASSAEEEENDSDILSEVREWNNRRRLEIAADLARSISPTTPPSHTDDQPIHKLSTPEEHHLLPPSSSSIRWRIPSAIESPPPRMPSPSAGDHDHDDGEEEDVSVRWRIPSVIESPPPRTPSPSAAVHHLEDEEEEAGPIMKLSTPEEQHFPSLGSSSISLAEDSSPVFKAVPKIAWSETSTTTQQQSSGLLRNGPSGASGCDDDHHLKGVSVGMALVNLVVESEGSGGEACGAGSDLENNNSNKSILGIEAREQEHMVSRNGKEGLQPVHAGEHLVKNKDTEGLEPVNPAQAVLHIKDAEGLEPVNPAQAVLYKKDTEGLEPVTPAQAVVHIKDTEGFEPVNPAQAVVHIKDTEGLEPVKPSQAVVHAPILPESTLSDQLQRTLIAIDKRQEEVTSERSRALMERRKEHEVQRQEAEKEGEERKRRRQLEKSILSRTPPDSDLLYDPVVASSSAPLPLPPSLWNLLSTDLSSVRHSRVCTMVIRQLAPPAMAEFLQWLLLSSSSSNISTTRLTTPQQQKRKPFPFRVIGLCSTVLCAPLSPSPTIPSSSARAQCPAFQQAPPGEALTEEPERVIMVALTDLPDDDHYGIQMKGPMSGPPTSEPTARLLSVQVQEYLRSTRLDDILSTPSLCLVIRPRPEFTRRTTTPSPSTSPRSPSPTGVFQSDASMSDNVSPKAPLLPLLEPIPEMMLTTTSSSSMHVVSPSVVSHMNGVGSSEDLSSSGPSQLVPPLRRITPQSPTDKSPSSGLGPLALYAGVCTMRLFTLPLAFFTYSSSVKPGSAEAAKGDEPSSNDIDTSVMAFKEDAFEGEGGFSQALQRANEEGLDLVALRMIYVSDTHRSSFSTLGSFQLPPTPQINKAIITCALRGPNAVQRWQHIVGPEDPQLARHTDSNSLRALYGKDRARNLLVCTRSVSKSVLEMSYLFGGRIPEDGYLQAPLLSLVVPYPSERISLILRENIPPSSYGPILRLLLERGFRIGGINRVVLEESLLADIDEDALPSTGPSMVALLDRENAVYNAHAVLPLIQSLARGNAPTDEGTESDFETADVAEVGTWSVRVSATCWEAEVETDILREIVLQQPDRQAVSDLLRTIGGPLPPCNPELEHIVFLGILSDVIPSAGTLLSSITETVSTPSPKSPTYSPSAFEVLGVKYIHSIREWQASNSSPYVAKASAFGETAELAGSSLVAVVLRRVNGFMHLRKFVDDLEAHIQQSLLLSTTPDAARTLICSFFLESELNPDTVDVTPDVLYQPPSTLALFQTITRGVSHIEPLTTVAILKGDLLQRGHVARALKHFVHGGFEIVGMSMLHISDRLAATRYAGRTDIDSSPDDAAVDVVVSAPVVAVALRRLNGIKKLIDLAGPEDPAVARKVDEFSLRATFGTDLSHNAIHISRTYADAVKEVQLLFPDLPGSAQTDQQAHTDISMGNKAASQRRYLPPPIGSLMQTICVLLSPRLVNDSGAAVTVLDSVLRDGFALVQLRLVRMSEKQAIEYASISGAPFADRMVADLQQGPCLVLALDRTNAISRFQLLLSATTPSSPSSPVAMSPSSPASTLLVRSGSFSTPSLGLTGTEANHCIASTSASYAAKQLPFFFNELYNSVSSIVESVR